MSTFERHSARGATELPECRCGKVMHIASIDPLLEPALTHIRVYDCPACQHEMRVTVWGADTLS